MVVKNDKCRAHGHPLNLDCTCVGTRGQALGGANEMTYKLAETDWKPSAKYPGYVQRINGEGYLETMPASEVWKHSEKWPCEHCAALDPDYMSKGKP